MRSPFSYKPLNPMILSSRPGEWLSLPMGLWRCRIEPGRLLVEEGHSLTPLVREISWPTFGLTEQFEIALDAARAQIEVKIRAASEISSSTGQVGHGQSLIWLIKATSEGTFSLELLKSKEESIDLLINKEPLCLLRRERVLLSPLGWSVMKKEESHLIAPLGLPKRQKGNKRAPYSIQTDLVKAPESTKSQPIELWFGTHAKLDWQKLIDGRQGDKAVWALAHQWLLTSTQLPSHRSLLLENSAYGELVDALSSLLVDAGADWPKRWHQLARAACIGPLTGHLWSQSPLAAYLRAQSFEIGAATSQVHSTEILSWCEILQAFAHLFFDRFCHAEQQGNQLTLRLSANAHSRAPAGRLALTLDTLQLYWRWRALRSRELFLYNSSEETLYLKLQLEPYLRLEPYSGRFQPLNQSKHPLGEAQWIQAKGKVLDLELGPQAHYRLDRLEY